MQLRPSGLYDAARRRHRVVLSAQTRALGQRLALGYVGRLTPEKNVRTLAAVEKQLLSSGFRDFRFVIVGAGSERAWLEQNLQKGVATETLRLKAGLRTSSLP